jgi:hypothetical protein
MLREQTRVEILLRDKDQVIKQQKLDLDKLKLTSNSGGGSSGSSGSLMTSTVGLSPAILGGSLRLHGSFRQYKKDREKIRHNNLKTSNLSGSSSSGVNVNSSEDSSTSSPSTLPRTFQRPVLRMTVSASTVEDQISAPKLKKGILKACASIDSSSPVSIVQPGLNNHGSRMINISTAAAEDRSDSGRESDDIEQLIGNPVNPNVSVVTVSTDSANSSFDASDPTLSSLKINVFGPKEMPTLINNNNNNNNNKNNKKVKPPPPPRSSHTKLTSSSVMKMKPKSILSPTTSLNPDISPTEALDNLIHNVDRLKLTAAGSENNNNKKTKRVKFNPKVEASDPLQLTPLDPNFLHFLPRLTSLNIKQDVAKKEQQNNNNVSYYEPYI